MERENNYEKLYQEMLQYQNELHLQNQKHIRNGIKCVIFIPLIFLALVFLTDSGKVVFLTLWIISMFLLSAYLIYIEYLDFQVQELVAKMSRNQNLETKALIGDGLDDFESNILDILKEWEDSLPPRRKIEDIIRSRHQAAWKQADTSTTSDKEAQENSTKKIAASDVDQPKIADTDTTPDRKKETQTLRNGGLS